MPVAIAAPFHSSSPITPSITGGIAVRTATISFELGTVVCAPAAAVQIRNAMAANPSRLRTAPYLRPIRYFKIFCSLNEILQIGRSPPLPDANPCRYTWVLNPGLVLAALIRVAGATHLSRA